MKTSVAILALSSVLVACGGGGSDSDSPQVTNSPLAKYAGTYALCDGDHAYITITNQLDSAGSLVIKPKTDYYDKADCTGEIKGTEVWSDGIRATYRTTQVEGVYGIVFMGERRPIDLVSATASNIRATLTGPGVFNNCVAYTGGNYCLESSSISLNTNDLAMYLDDISKDFVLLSKSNNDYVLVYKAAKK